MANLREELLWSIGPTELKHIEDACAEIGCTLDFYVEANATKPSGIMDRLGLTLDDVSAENIAKTSLMARLIEGLGDDPSNRSIPNFSFKNGVTYG